MTIAASALVEKHQRRIDLIAQCANESSSSELERRWLSVLRSCAAWFSSLPLSAELYHEPGGAFRCTVETAFYAMRLAGGQKFGTSLPSEKRRRIEPQYNYAVFLAAVCSRLDEPYRHFKIERDSDRAVWNPSIHGAAGSWLGTSAYRVAVRDHPLPIERMRTGMLAQMLVGQDLLVGLDGEVLSEMFGAINPIMQPQGAESLLHKVVRQGVNVADESDRKAQRGIFEPVKYTVPSAVQVAAHLQPVVVPAAPSPTTPGTPSPSPSHASSATPASTPAPSSCASTRRTVPRAASVSLQSSLSDGNSSPGARPSSAITPAIRS